MGNEGNVKLMRPPFGNHFVMTLLPGGGGAIAPDPLLQMKRFLSLGRSMS